MVMIGGNKKVNILKWLKYPGDNDAIGNSATILAKAYHLSILSILSNSVKSYSGVSVTIVSHPMFSHENMNPIPTAMIPQYN